MGKSKPFVKIELTKTKNRLKPWKQTIKPWIPKSSKKTETINKDSVQHKEAQRLNALHMQSNRCHWCCKSMDNEKPYIDHVIPRAYGGSNDDANLRISCFRCNGLKSASSGIDYALYLLGANYIPYKRKQTKTLHHEITPKQLQYERVKQGSVYITKLSNICNV